MPGLVFIVCLGLAGLAAVIETGVATAAQARDDKKIVHGVLLPLGAFISLNLSLFGLIFREDYSSFFGVFFWFFVCLCILVILISNTLLMLPKWKSRWTVWLIGSSIPVCLFVAQVLFWLSVSLDDSDF